MVKDKRTEGEGHGKKGGGTWRHKVEGREIYCCYKPVYISAFQEPRHLILQRVGTGNLESNLVKIEINK